MITSIGYSVNGIAQPSFCLLSVPYSSLFPCEMRSHPRRRRHPIHPFTMDSNLGTPYLSLRTTAGNK